MIGTGLPLSTFNAVITEDIVNNKAFNHKCFSVSKRFTLAKNTTANVAIDTTASCDHLVFLPFVVTAFGAGPIEIDFYLNPTLTEGTGTAWTPFDRNDVSPVSCDLKITYGPTVGNYGTKLPPEWTVFSNGNAATAKAGGETGEKIVFFARKNSTYMFKVTNKDAANTANIQVALSWFEV